MSRYYDKIYNHQRCNRSVEEVHEFVGNILSKVENKKSCLDVGCGTGIYTNLIHGYFKKTTGIDPCESMIEKCHNPNIVFKCLYLNELASEQYDLITSFSQILNHLSSIESLDTFIKDVSQRLVGNGIFYFDVFNYDFFTRNEPLKESRQLSNNVKYNIYPKIMSRSNDHINMVLNNEIVDNGNAHKYILSMYIWNIGVIEDICAKYNIQVITKCRMFDLSTNIHESPKISMICQKQNS